MSAYKLIAETSGPTKKEQENEEILPMDEGNFTLVRKFQKCGKRNCRCQRGQKHGPYYWRVYWDKAHQKQIWKYVGKKHESK